jgi:AcrR family transcriptional regulator
MEPHSSPAFQPESTDPRIQRTRRILRDSLEKLLERKDFDDISVGEIAAAAGVNRATFYDHYPDKFQLLECLVSLRFDQLLADRQAHFSAVCASALKAIVLALCDYLSAAVNGACGRARVFNPHMELTLVKVVRRSILTGLQREAPQTAVPLEFIAAAGSWAMYGAAREWINDQTRGSADDVLPQILTVIVPIFDQVFGNTANVKQQPVVSG